MTNSQARPKCNQRTALIVGVNGQDGSYLAEHLAIEGWQVYGFGRQETVRPELIKFLFKYETVDLSDIAQYERALSKCKPSVIFYTAAVHGAAGFEYESVWLDTHKVNTLCLHATLEHIRLKNASSKIIYFSSAKVFGPLDRQIVNEESNRYSHCLYSLTKNSSENLIKYYRNNHNIDASILWLFNHESIQRTHQHFVMKLLLCLRQSEKNPKSVTNFETIDFWCDWGFAKEYMELIAKNWQAFGNEDFVLATGTTVWAREIVEELFSKRGLSASQNISTLRSSDKPESTPWRVNIDKFKNFTKSEPSISGIDVFENIYLELTKLKIT